MLVTGLSANLLCPKAAAVDTCKPTDVCNRSATITASKGVGVALNELMCEQPSLAHKVWAALSCRQGLGIVVVLIMCGDRIHAIMCGHRTRAHNVWASYACS
mgnify:CR=1 FL=1